MKKIILILIFIISINTFSQTMNYGLVLGINATDTESKNGNSLYASDAPGLDGFNVGAYFDYPINNKLGIKSYLTFNSENETYSSSTLNEFNFDLKVNSIQLSSVLKYHFNNEYNEGFYILSGPRISNILSTESQASFELNDTHKNFNFGLQFGFGFKIFKFINTEFIGDYGFSDIIEDENIKVNTFNFKLNLNFNLEHLRNK